jgi:hypothetical protein
VRDGVAEGADVSAADLLELEALWAPFGRHEASIRADERERVLSIIEHEAAGYEYADKCSVAVLAVIRRIREGKP